jgi:callose synthase
MYRPTCRGFVIAHSSFDENFRFFASSHIYLGFELAFALILFGVYTTSTQYYGVTWSLWLAAISFTIGPFWFNPLSFEWNRIKDDYLMWIAWMNELGGTSEQSWEAWWKEENRYFYDLSTSWKVCLFIQKFFVWMVVAYGIGGKSVLTSQDDQNCMLKVLTVFVLFFFSNWVLHKLERTWTYAVRRVTRLIIWITMLSTLILLFINHLQYIRFTIATYYLIAALVYLFLLCNCHNQVIVVYKVHDYIIGHAIFLLLSVLALCQVSDIHRAPFLLVIDFIPYLRIQ